MDAAIIGLISAVIVSIITQLAWWFRDRRNHKESKEDKTEEKNDKVIKAIDELGKRIDNLGYKVDQTDAKQSRVRILLFDDELLHGRVHTHDHYRQILEDIDNYEKFCDEHPGFRNGLARHAIEHIRNTYDVLQETGDFLQ